MNEFREWLSDNLRYIMLGVGVLLGLVVIFFGIRFITTAVGSDPTNQGTVADVSPTPETTATPTPTPTLEVLVMEDMVENGVPEITTLIKKYFNAIASDDITTLRTLVDNLSLEDEVTITADTVTSYSDIRVFTKVSQTPGVYIVLASYKYQLSGINTLVPGLTQLCVHTANDGSLYVSTAGPNATLQLEIDQTLKTSEVENLIDNIQSQFETALDSDPALYAFFYPNSSQTANNSGSSSSTNNTGNGNSTSNTTGNSNSNSTGNSNNAGNSNNTGNSSNSGFNNNSGNNNATNNGTSNSANPSITPEPTWSPDSKPIVDTDGGIIATPTPPEDRQLVLEERAYLYEKPDESSDYIRPYPKNTQVVKLEDDGDFYYVDIHGERGYMLKSSFK